MAKVRKRGNRWQLDYFDPHGKRIRMSFVKKKDADAELAKRVSLIAEKRYLDIKKDYTTTFVELLSKYEENFMHQASYDNWKRVCIERFKKAFGEHTLLSNIRYVQLESYRNKLRTTLTSRGTIRKDATINREISCLHHIFTKAYEWELIERNPFDRGKSMLLKENNKRDRYLERDEIQNLLATCPPHLRKIVECVLHTGMRKQEVLGLKWEQIRGDFIYLRKTKTNESREIPINDTLALLFQKIRKDQQLRSQYVFTYAASEDKLVDLKPVRERKKPAPVPDRLLNLKSSFSSAVKRAGIENFTFHDLRHTFASHFVMHGGSLRALQQILGHRKIETTMRYAHLSPDHKIKAVNLLNGLTAPSENPMCHKTVTKPISQVSSSM